MKHPCRGQIVYELPIVVPGVMTLEADTEERAKSQAAAVEALAQKAAHVEQPLLDWSDRLPDLLTAATD